MNKNKPRVLLLWIILWIVIGPIINFRNSIAAGNVEIGRVIFVGAMMAIPLAILGLIIWGVMKLIIKAVMPGKEIDIKTALGIWFVIFVILFMLPLFKKQTGIPASQVSKQYQYGVGVLNAINKERANKGLPSLKIDENLCAFARKKALEYAKGTPQKSFTEETKDPANSVYFSGFGNIVLDSIEGGLLSKDEEFAKDFMSRNNEGATALNITNGCVADSTGSGAEDGKFYTVFVGATKQ